MSTRWSDGPSSSRGGACTTRDEWVTIEETDFAPESGIHPTVRCLTEGEDLRAALLRLCDDDAPRARVWSIVPVPRKPR